MHSNAHKYITYSPMRQRVFDKKNTFKVIEYFFSRNVFRLWL